MYRFGFAQFLRWAAKEWDKPAYNEFAEGLKYKVKTEGKNPNTLLAEEEIDRMINAAARRRDQAILSVLAESGCRVGELSHKQHCYKPAQEDAIEGSRAAYACNRCSKVANLIQVHQVGTYQCPESSS
jgi:hypothetical protein